LHHRQAEALGGAALELALHGEWVDRLADVLRGGELDDLDQSELGIDVDHCAMRRKCELHVNVRLARLRVEMLGGPRMELACLLDHGVTEESGEGDDRHAICADDLVVLDAKPTCGVELGLRELEHAL